MTRDISIPGEVWTLVTVNSCSFQADANMQVSELDVSPTNWEDPKKVILKSKIYEYVNTSGKGLWALSNTDALITIDDSSTISETSGGYLRQAINPLGGFDVYIQDQNSDIIDYYICINLFDLELAAATVIDSYTLSLVSGVNVVNGTYLCIQEGKRAFQAKVLSGGGTNTITIDTPIDYTFSTDASISNRSPNLNVNGSMTPVVSSLAPVPGVKWDITRVILNITDDLEPDDGKFGGISGGLTRGIVLRKTDGIHHTLFNAKTNGDLRERAYDVNYSDRASPATGSYGVSMRRSFAGQDKNGVTIRLDGDSGDALEILIQDNLTGLSSFRVVAQGHVVE